MVRLGDFARSGNLFVVVFCLAAQSILASESNSSTALLNHGDRIICGLSPKNSESFSYFRDLVSKSEANVYDLQVNSFQPNFSEGQNCAWAFTGAARMYLQNSEDEDWNYSFQIAVTPRNVCRASFEVDYDEIDFRATNKHTQRVYMNSIKVPARSFQIGSLALPGGRQRRGLYCFKEGTDQRLIQTPEVTRSSRVSN